MQTPSPYYISPPQDGPIPLAEFMEVEDQGSAIRDYWLVVRDHRWIILACVVAVVLVVSLYTFTRTTIYTAQATLLIERKPPQVVKMQDALSESLEIHEYYKTQYEILKSRALAARVVREAGLQKEAIFGGNRDRTAAAKGGLVSGLGTAFRDWKANLFPPQKKAGGPAADASEAIIDAYLSMIAVKPVPGTGLVRVAFSTPDPALSARLANDHSASYVRYGMDLRSDTNEAALQFLEKKLLELKGRVESSEAALNSYRRDAGIISLSDKENIVVDRLADLNKRLTEAEAERIALEAQVRTVQSGKFDALPVVVNNPAIQALKSEVGRLEGEHSKLANEFKAGYPPLDKAAAQLESLRRRLQTEIRNEVRTIEAAYLTARTKEGELRAIMEEQKTATLSLKDSAVQYAILAREVDTNKQLYDGVLQRIKEMGVAADVRTTNIHLMEQAKLPRGPSYPNKRRSLMLALVIGLSGGIALAFLLERLDSTFKSPSELERFTRLPNMTLVPDFALLGDQPSVYVPRMLQMRKENHRNLPAKTAAKDLILEYHPLSVVAESYRTLRSAILLSRAEEPPRTILLTSAGAGEGKTTTVVNTAVVFAQMGARVLIIDCDLRRPRCHKILGVDNDIGLTEFLAGQVEVEKVLKPTKAENLYVITSGARPPNPAELLGSKKMRETINILREQWDYVFIDSSPLLAVSEAVVLATMVDGVLLVVDSDKTPKHVVKDARMRLNNPRINMLGVLLNRVNTREGTYASYYGRYHDYYHGDEITKESA